jgi:uncharacterized membrane protein YpjA
VWVPHVAFSLSMQEALIGDKMQWLLLPCHLVGMLSMFVSEVIFSALFNFLLLMFLVAYLAYNLVVYIRYLHTAAPRYERMHHAVSQVCLFVCLTVQSTLNGIFMSTSLTNSCVLFALSSYMHVL